MNKFKKFRLKLLSSLGVNLGLINEIPDSTYNILRYRYHQNLPASFYLLFENMPNNSQIIKVLLLSTMFYDDFKVIIADNCYSKNYAYLETGDTVYDPELGIIADKSYYEIIFGIKNKELFDKEKVEDYKKSIKICDCDMWDCQKIPFDVIDEIIKQKNNYKGSRKKLIERQVDSYLKDIQYEDGLMIINMDHVK